MPEIAVDKQLSSTPSGPEENTEASMEIGDLLVEDVSIDGMCGVY